MKRHPLSIWSDKSAAVAPIVALSLFALIGVGGIAFDYARMASLDTEMQNAADQAALAAATQLDQQAGAVARATAAAQGLLANKTLFANDGNASGLSITVPTVLFYATKANAEAANGTNCPTANTVTADATAKFVCVRTANRVANFALTPIVAAFSSGNISAMAVAGLGSAICKTPPVMMCNPSEPIGNTNINYAFDADSLKGVGILLIGDGSYKPGNFGFLETNFGNGANDLLKALGYTNPPGDCAETSGVDTKTGMNASVMDGINTRFDVNANGNSCPGGDANCSPSINVRKGLVRGNQCGITGQGWTENDSDSSNFNTRNYKPTSATVYPSTTTPDIMGHPRDLCHAYDGTTWSCGGVANRRIGTGDWDINAYWRSNFSGADYAGEVSAATYGSQPKGYPTRYQVYQWEIDNYTTKLGNKNGQGTTMAYSRPQASMCLATPTSPYGIVPSSTVVDRRRISVAVMNCEALGISGHEVNQTVLKWVDVFLVEPSYARTKCSSGAGCNTKYTDKTDVYVEMIGETQAGAGQTAGQVVRRDVPYLVK
jgi:Flp pilus assembly protein TadG